MAKKTAGKKSSGKKSAGKKSTGKSMSKKPASRKAAGPKKISTGKGATPAQIGADLVALYNAGKHDEPCRKYWSPQIESIEGIGLGWKGKAAVEAKNAEWMKTHIIHATKAEGLYVGSTGFAVRFSMDVEDTTNGSRFNMGEVGVYTVKNGKIVREEFMYAQ